MSGGGRYGGKGEGGFVGEEGRKGAIGGKFSSLI